MVIESARGSRCCSLSPVVSFFPGLLLGSKRDKLLVAPLGEKPPSSCAHARKPHKTESKKQIVYTDRL